MTLSAMRLGGALYPVPEGAGQNWQTTLINKDGTLEDVTGKIAGVISHHPGINTTVAYGYPASPFAQYDQWVVTQGDPDGVKGGTSILPWTRLSDGRLYVLVVEEDRHLIDRSQKTWGPPGGFLDRGETHASGAARETEEEAGLEIGNASLELLPGIGVCLNRAFFDVLPTPNIGEEGNGDYYFTRQLPAAMFYQDSNDIWRIDRSSATFSGAASGMIKANKQGELLTRLVPLFPVENLVGTPDAVLIVSVARLLPYLAEKGEIILADAKIA